MDYYEGSGSSLANLTLFINGSEDYEGIDVYADQNITANRTDDEGGYCTSEAWAQMRTSYKMVHGCMSLAVCVFGSIANIINMVVLTRRSMVSPTNAILTALAIADLLVMVVYLPYTMHVYVWVPRAIESRFSWGWAVYVLFQAQSNQVFHTISIFLTVTLAVWRYIAIALPQNNASWCSMKNTQLVIVLTFLCSVICNIPNYLNIAIIQKEYDGAMLYFVGFSELALANGGLLKSINFWIYSVLMKLLPCVALTGLSIALIQELLLAAKRRAALMKRATVARNANAQRQADRVTTMLLAILVLFLVSEVPQGILCLLAVIPDSGFFKCYQQLGEMMDMLVLFNSAVNFLLYCAMSQQFRDTFTQLFRSYYVYAPSLPQSWKSMPVGDSRGESNNTCITHV
ncbi:G-protein coupled receptor dmsr-1-like [Penaeus vannamei]|uniref:G-protein coupled receptor dmsr-1-like n=1 Tax=Penaeus vannamei TaxID=6689 RepID=UPI00387F9F44